MGNKKSKNDLMLNEGSFPFSIFFVMLEIEKNISFKKNFLIEFKKIAIKEEKLSNYPDYELNSKKNLCIYDYLNAINHLNKIKNNADIQNFILYESHKEYILLKKIKFLHKNVFLIKFDIMRLIEFFKKFMVNVYYINEQKITDIGNDYFFLNYK